MQRTTIQQTATPPPDLRLCRQSVESDVAEVVALQTTSTGHMFGDVDVARCVENRVCKTLVNVDDEIVAFLVVKDHPNIPAISHCNWTGWIRRYYRIDYATPWNTLFVHYLVWDPRYPNFFSPLLKTLYKNNPKLQQVLLVTPPKIQIFTELESLFTVVYPSFEGIVGSILTPFQNIHINLRHQVVSKLTVRRAGEEDNIDVQPLVHHQLEVLRYVFGDVRPGNVIDLKTPTKSVLVAEKGGSVTVGVLSASSRVDYNYINVFFHHFFESNQHRDSVVGERGGLARMDTNRSELRRGLPFTPETMSTEDQLSLDLNNDIALQPIDENSADEDEDRDKMVVYWDENGDCFTLVDPFMGYFLYDKHKGTERPELDSKSSTRKESALSQQTIDYTYWPRSSRSNSVLHTQNESTMIHERLGTVSTKDQSMNMAYTPTENAFLLTLFALHPDLDPRYAYDMLEASFECFSDKLFCLLSLPTAYQGSPLTKYMVRMPPKMTRDFPQELYVTHRNAVFSVFSCRPVSFADHLGIHELIENVSQGKKISRDMSKIFFSECPGTKGYVLECEGNIVGVAVVNTNFSVDQLQPHFKIDEIINLKLYDYQNHGLIRHLVLCPIFLKSSAFFLRQIMNQTNLETLSYCLFPDDTINLISIDFSPITVLGEMTPVKPRRRIHYDLSALDEFAPQDHVLHIERDYALFIATEKTLNTPKLELTYRIVVVGGSDTALSFLENLIFRSARKHIQYANLTLVSIHGFPLELRPHSAGDKMVPHGGVYTREYLTRISLATHVNVLYGALSVINRTEKMICINKDHWIRYDYLFLTTGMQFCKPWPALDFPSMKHGSTGQTMSCTMSESDSCLRDDRDFPKQDCRKNEDIRELYSRANEQYAENLFVINTTADSIIALSHLKKYFKHKKDGKVLVYGQGLNLYTCVESLLVFGVPGSKIVLFLSPQPNLCHGCIENNPFVEKTIVQVLEESGVTIHRGYSLICWSLKHKYVDKVMFRNNDNIPMTLDCVALFCYGNKCTNAKTYMAVTDAGIVYNNGIIIDSQFRTNDEFIFAAGPGTRYSNRYHPSQYVHHKYYNSTEIGTILSKTFRRLVEPRADDYKLKKVSTFSEIAESSSWFTGRSGKLEASTHPEILPELQEPVTWVAHLPGGWMYVKVSSPGRPVPLECQFNGQGDCGPILITGVPILPDGPGYFQLSFSVYNTVREIVLLSKKVIPYQNLCQLYGKHERLLNNLYEQYNQGLIGDFFAFFAQPWAYAMYTTRFDELSQQCAEIFVNSESVGLPHFHEVANRQFSSTLKRLRSGDQEAISSRYLSSSVPMYVEHLTLKFISERPLNLPMYYTDAVLTAWLQSSVSNSPLHRDPAKLRQKKKTSTPSTQPQRVDSFDADF